MNREMDVAGLQAIDVHVHVEKSAVSGKGSLSPDLEAAADQYFKRSEVGRPTIDELAEYYRQRSMAAIVFTVDATTSLGVRPIPNEEIAAGAAEHADVLIPFASLDPHLGDWAVDQVAPLVADHGVRGFKFHPSIQAFDPNDRSVYRLYEAIEAAGAIALFHTGQTGIGAGTPGGAGIRLRHSNPMLVDDVAADFPELDIILAHPSFPWQDEALAVATHKPRVYIDLSGWSPKYFPANLKRYARTLLQDKVLFGSDMPMITPDRWLRHFDGLGFDEDVRRKILKGNAVRLLGLSSDDAMEG